MSDHIIVSQQEGVQTIKISRLDKKNALTDEMYHALVAAFNESQNNEDIRVNVIFGEQGAFTAGNDLADFLTMAETGEMTTGVVAFLKCLAISEVPLVLGIDGLAVGIGTTMTLHADLIYATKNTTFITPFTDLALIPEAASTILMPATIGYARAFEMLALGEPVTAEQAKELGFINKIINDDELETVVLGAAKKLANKPKSALKAARRLMRPHQESILRQIDAELSVFADQLKTEEAKSAFQRFLSKSA